SILLEHEQAAAAQHARRPRGAISRGIRRGERETRDAFQLAVFQFTSFQQQSAAPSLKQGMDTPVDQLAKAAVPLGDEIIAIQQMERFTDAGGAFEHPLSRIVVE